MRTLLILAAGLGLAAAALALTRSSGQPTRVRTGALAFTLVWLIATLANLGLGVRHGYTVAEELPIFALLFGVPTAAAWIAAQRLSR